MVACQIFEPDFVRMMMRYLLPLIITAAIPTHGKSFMATLQVESSNVTIHVDTEACQVLAPREGEIWKTLTVHTFAINWMSIREGLGNNGLAFIYVAQVIEGYSVYQAKSGLAFQIGGSGENGENDPSTYASDIPDNAPGPFVLLLRAGDWQPLGELDRDSIFGISGVFSLSHDTDAPLPTEALQRRRCHPQYPHSRSHHIPRSRRTQPRLHQPTQVRRPRQRRVPLQLLPPTLDQQPSLAVPSAVH